MTEQKKPSPANKHETRLQTESRPAGIAPSTYTEKPGGSIDMIEIVGEKPRVVRVAQGAYDRMVKDGTEFYARDFFGAIPDAATSAWTTIGAFTVPPGMAYDLTRYHFSAYKMDDGNTTWFSFHDDTLLGRVLFRVAFDGVTPWDVRLMSGGFMAMLGPSTMGLPWLNRNHLDLGGDCPVHLIAVEGQQVAVQYYHYNGALWTILDNNNTLCWSGCVRGRWIPIQHYRRIIGANALE